MQLVSFIRIVNHRAACACCGHDRDYAIECRNNTSMSQEQLCFRCYHVLEAVTLVENGIIIA